MFLEYILLKNKYYPLPTIVESGSEKHIKLFRQGYDIVKDESGNEIKGNRQLVTDAMKKEIQKFYKSIK